MIPAKHQAGKNKSRIEINYKGESLSMTTTVISTIVLTMMQVLYEKGVLSRDDGYRIIKAGLAEAQKQLEELDEFDE